MQNENGMASFLHTMEGVTIGETLAMFAFGIGRIALIRNLNTAHPDVTQTWYDDDAGALGMYGNINLYFNFLRHSCLGCGY